jgi:hypothetical protein
MWSRGFELAYATTAGDQIQVPLVDAWSLRLESVPPVRRFGRIEGNAIWSVVVGHRWRQCLIRVVAGTRPDAAGLRPDGDRYRLPAVLAAVE